ncbi:ATP-binding cassette domain-containing protein [Streptomyces sp. NBC_01431]|nr:ATP-binding cassette domain-containing protein [Streptomyces sp. NBC_01431]
MRGVGRRYGIGGPWILRGIDLDLRTGTLVRIAGTNGTGKSTLLRLVAGIDAPSEGRVAGRPRTAYVPERFPAALPFTAAGYLVHLGRVHGLPGRTAKERAERWLERFGAAEHASTPLAELSKGTSQKVAVAQALLAAPELLVLDEAWTGLDTDARAELDGAVKERVAAGTTVVFVDHDPKRLAGSEDERYALCEGSLKPLGAASHPGLPERLGADLPGAFPTPLEVVGNLVHIDVVGPAPSPADLPGAPALGPGPDGSHVLTVAAAHSDDLLRALLAARPPWHIRGVRRP